MGDLTRHFSMAEFLVSDTASKLGIANLPTPAHRKRIETILAPGMELVRALFGTALVISSAYRNPRVNRLVGGVANSAHPQAWAADFRVAMGSAFATAKICAAAMGPGGPLHGKVDQLILETSRKIVHISFDPREGKGGPRGQILTQKGGPGTLCVKGIVA